MPSSAASAAIASVLRWNEKLGWRSAAFAGRTGSALDSTPATGLEHQARRAHVLLCMLAYHVEHQHAIEALARQFMAQLCHNKRKIAISFSQFTWLHFLAIFRKAPPNSTPYSFRKKEVRPSFWLAPGALTGWTDWLRMVDGVSPSGFGALGLG